MTTTLPDGHYYLVNVATKEALGVDRFLSSDEGMYAGTAINQYVHKGYPYKESFKFRPLPADSDAGIRFNSKRTGMCIGVKGNSTTDRAQLVQGFEGNDIAGTSLDWQLNQRELEGKPCYEIVNLGTGGSMAVPASNEADDSWTLQSFAEFGPLSAWHVIEAKTFEYFDANPYAPGFQLQKDIRDNNWFKLVVPNPSDIPYVGATASDKIDAIGKLLGIFPDQNAFEELYKSLVKAMQQIIGQGFIKDNIDDALGQLNAARASLDTVKQEKNEDMVWQAMNRAKLKYDEVIGPLMVSVNASAGLYPFMQAASEQLAILHSMAGLRTKGDEVVKEKAKQYADHLEATYRKMSDDRMGLILTKLFLVPLSTQTIYLDEYQDTRICQDTKEYMPLDQYRNIMHEHFSTELGHPLDLVSQWRQLSSIGA